jgi:RNA polymerase sigma-32 factor
VAARKKKTHPKKSAAASADVEVETADSAGLDDGSDSESDLDNLDDAEGVVIETSGEYVGDRPLSSPPSAAPAPSSQALARVDPLQVYMNEVQRHPLLSPDEQHALAVKYAETGDVEAAAKLVTANLRLVVKIAYDYRRAYRNMMDLIQEGNIGLMQAVKRYDPYRGVKLSSYAAWWIRAYMLRFVLNNWRLVKIGTTQAQRKLFFNLNKEKAKLSAMGIEPTHAEIAQRLGVEEKEVVEMDRRLSRGDASLDSPIAESDGKATTRMELLPAAAEGPDVLAEDAELQMLAHKQFDAFRRTLQGKDLAIFERRMMAEDPVTLQQLGNEFGISRERVRQLEARLYGRLRDFVNDTLGDAVDVAS